MLTFPGYILSMKFWLIWGKELDLELYMHFFPRPERCLTWELMMLLVYDNRTKQFHITGTVWAYKMFIYLLTHLFIKHRPSASSVSVPWEYCLDFSKGINSLSNRMVSFMYSWQGFFVPRMVNIRFCGLVRFAAINLCHPSQQEHGSEMTDY